MASFNIPEVESDILEARARSFHMSPTAYIRLMITDPPRFAKLYEFTVGEHNQSQSKVVLAEVTAARSASPAAQDRAERAAAKEQASERIGTLNSLIGQIGGKVSHREGEDSSVEGEHAKLRATRVYPHCPQWQKLHDQYLSDGQAYEYKEGLRRLRDQLEAEIKQLKKDPTLVLNVAACTQFPMLK